MLRGILCYVYFTTVTKEIERKKNAFFFFFNGYKFFASPAAEKPQEVGSWVSGAQVMGSPTTCTQVSQTLPPDALSYRVRLWLRGWRGTCGHPGPGVPLQPSCSGAQHVNNASEVAPHWPVCQPPATPRGLKNRSAGPCPQTVR